MKNNKPYAYLEKKIVGHWMLNPEYSWIALDDWGHEVARAKTKKECETATRRAGYVPVKE